MSSSNPFLTAILANPADDAVRLACADWLQEEDRSPLWGRFMAASLVLARYRGVKVIVDHEYMAAAAELDATAPVVIQQMSRAIGLRAEGERWIWDAKDDLVTGTQVAPRGRLRPGRHPEPPRIILTRGLLSEARAPLAWCRDRLAKTLARCPVEKVEVLDVPRLEFDVIALPSGCWELKTTLSVRPRTYDAGGGIWRLMPSDRWSWGREYNTRDDMVADATQAIPDVVEQIRQLAGDRWPGPREEDEG